MITISIRLLIEEGFSNGWAELALKKPPPLVPSCLMASWLATGPSAIDCLAPSTVWASTWASRVCGTPRAASIRHGMDNGFGQQDVEGHAHQVGPEVADGLAAIGGEGARQGGRHRHGHDRRDEVLHGQPGHLRQVAGGALTRIELPVGVGDEADRRIESQLRRHGGEMLRVQRQMVPQTQDGVEEEEGRGGEGQEGHGVGEPGLALGFPVDARRAIEDRLGRFPAPDRASTICLASTRANRCRSASLRPTARPIVTTISTHPWIFMGIYPIRSLPVRSRATSM